MKFEKKYILYLNITYFLKGLIDNFFLLTCLYFCFLLKKRPIYDICSVSLHPGRRTVYQSTEEDMQCRQTYTSNGSKFAEHSPLKLRFEQLHNH